MLNRTKRTIWSNHILDQEDNIPINVIKTISFFEINSIGYNLSRNDDAMSCLDASSKRIRNGNIGIPLSDELKTYFGEYRTSSNTLGLVAINLAGHKRIDFEKVKNIIGATNKIKLVNKSTLNIFNLSFGKINPFIIYKIFNEKSSTLEHDSLITLFDNDLLSKKSTMLTNAGELSWGIEFKASEAIVLFKNCISQHSIVE